MYNMMGIILTGGKNNRLKELSAERSISASLSVENTVPLISPFQT